MNIDCQGYNSGSNICVTTKNYKACLARLKAEVLVTNCFTLNLNCALVDIASNATRVAGFNTVETVAQFIRLWKGILLTSNYYYYWCFDHTFEVGQPVCVALCLQGPSLNAHLYNDNLE
jgi:hypothetical protein